MAAALTGAHGSADAATAGLTTWPRLAHNRCRMMVQLQTPPSSHEPHPTLPGAHLYQQARERRVALGPGQHAGHAAWTEGRLGQAKTQTARNESLCGVPTQRPGAGEDEEWTRALLHRRALLDREGCAEAAGLWSPGCQFTCPFISPPCVLLFRAALIAVCPGARSLPGQQWTQGHITHPRQPAPGLELDTQRCPHPGALWLCAPTARQAQDAYCAWSLASQASRILCTRQHFWNSWGGGGQACERGPTGLRKPSPRCCRQQGGPVAGHLRALLSLVPAQP